MTGILLFSIWQSTFPRQGVNKNMPRIALLYVGCEGQTRKITETIGLFLTQAGHSTFIAPLTALTESFCLKSYDGVVIGASIRYGRHHRSCSRFITRNARQLAAMPGCFFSVNLTARKPERRDPYNNRYLQKFLQQIPWTPDRVDVFAGALLYTRYRWIDQQMIRLIMTLTGGPTDINKDTEFTDWQRVKNFARQLEHDFSATSRPEMSVESVL